MTYLIVLIVIAAVVFLISSPLRRGSKIDGTEVEVAELEAARDAKYREIRDAELDRQTGKLSDEDFQALDGTLRAEAVDILHRLDRAGASAAAGAAEPPPGSAQPAR